MKKKKEGKKEKYAYSDPRNMPCLYSPIRLRSMFASSKTFCKQAANMDSRELYMKKQVAFHRWRNSRRL